MHHTEKTVKVNAFVDHGIAEIIIALNQITDLRTIESCQGYGDEHAYVLFSYGGWNTLGCLLHDLYNVLQKHHAGNFSLSVHMWNLESPVAELRFDLNAIGKLSEEIELFATLHNSPCSCDRECKELHSLKECPIHRRKPLCGGGLPNQMTNRRHTARQYDATSVVRRVTNDENTVSHTHKDHPLFCKLRPSFFVRMP